MAKYFINATAADLGALPAGLVSASGSVVVEDPQSETGYSIRVDAANSSEKDVKFNNPLVNVTDFNIAIKIRRVSSGQNGGSIRLGSTSDRWDANWDGSEIRLRSGGITTRADGGFSRPAGVDWYIEKVSFNTETRIVTSIGYLASGSPNDGVEVAAQFSISPPSDNFLIYQAFNYPESRIEWIGVGTDGDAAPLAPVSEGITLSVDSISLSMAMDSATLTQANQLAVDSIELMTSLDAVTLQQAHVLIPDDISLSSVMDAVTLSSAGQLSVDSLQLNIGLESVALQQANVLSVDNLLLDTALESPDLSVGLTLVPDSIWLATLLDQVSLTQSHVLTVDDLTQSISLDNVTLTVAGQVIGPGTLTIGITGPSISIGISP